ncbi:unnamed protein product [Polarella glacialis]|uniref:Uncharacterized protein n=1 Tax=Polarella glacialis TaxID=89957 RepID=A0A813F083_POLGL|nr:unnamed protein product [Polarella glacialis]CAE8709754.1 unnamed protein product [Polarella glacialis]
MSLLQTLVVWDYDWSLINANSDTYVVEQLRPELLGNFDAPGASIAWTQLMHEQVGALHASGVSRAQLESCVAAVPVHEGCLRAIRLAAPLAEQVVLSDANTVFIESFLLRAELRQCFKEVITNPAEFDDQGRLHIRPYHGGPQHHGCPLCPANLCKGQVLERLRSTLGAESRVIYVGDGGGDFCPACDLRAGDALLVRSPPSPPLDHFGLKRRLEKSLQVGRQEVTRKGTPAAVAADIHPWHSGDDVFAILSKLLNG